MVFLQRSVLPGGRFQVVLRITHILLMSQMGVLISVDRLWINEVGLATLHDTSWVLAAL